MLPGAMSPKRKTRNFKGLLLKETPAPEPVYDDRAAPFARFIRSDDSHSSQESRNGLGGRFGLSGLATQLNRQPGVSPPLSNDASTPISSSITERRHADPPYVPYAKPPEREHDDISQHINRMDIGAKSDVHLDLSNANLRTISELGAGNGGTVTKVEHIPTGLLMAKKVVFIDARPEIRKQILRELQILHECHSEYIVGFYGACLSDIHIYMCMEYMDVGSLDAIYTKHGAIEVGVCGKIVETVVKGLSYLYESFRIIHRDVKPSNILVNRRGQIKLCDFGVSGELINSIADTFVGTSTYMSPERIQGDQYSIKSDVWSLGITIIELAHGSFPFAIDMEDDPDATTRAAPSAQDVRSLSILELLQHIVYEPPPQLNPEGGFPASMVDFVGLCLRKDPVTRPTPMELRMHPFIIESERSHVNLVAWLWKLGYQ